MAKCIIEHISYPSDGYRMLGWVMRPALKRQLPVLIYNHGFRASEPFKANLEQPTLSFDTKPWPGVANGGCAVFFPEGRGYAGSEGPTINDCRDTRDVVEYLDGRARDVIAGAEWLHAQCWADSDRFAVAGCSHGAVVSLFAAASGKFASVIAQAPGASVSHPMAGRKRMVAAIQKIDAPILLQHATDDLLCPFETSFVLSEAGERFGKTIKLRAYPPISGLDGHSQFDFENRSIWASDFDQALDHLFGVRAVLSDG